jgi:DNA-binding NarL/FixJ family response regulator
MRLASRSFDVGGDPGLTEDERRFIAELVTGRSDKRVASRLRTSDRTVRRWVSELMRRYGVTSRFALGVALGQRGLAQVSPVDPPPGPAGSDLAVLGPGGKGV